MVCVLHLLTVLLLFSSIFFFKKNVIWLLHQFAFSSSWNRFLRPALLSIYLFKTYYFFHLLCYLRNWLHHVHMVLLCDSLKLPFPLPLQTKSGPGGLLPPALLTAVPAPATADEVSMVFPFRAHLWRSAGRSCCSFLRSAGTGLSLYSACFLFLQYVCFLSSLNCFLSSLKMETVNSPPHPDFPCFVGVIWEEMWFLKNC